MQSTHEELYHRIKKVLEENIDAQKRYLKAADIAKHADVKLFFKQKAESIRLFNDRLLFELNYTFDFPKMEGSLAASLHRAWMETKDMLIDNSDASLLVESLRGDQWALEAYEELLTNRMLPISIRFLMKEQVTVIKLDGLKLDQLVNLK